MRPRPRTLSRELRVSISELAPGGDGVAIVDLDGMRRAVFVRGVAPGDEVRLAIDGARRPARGRVLELVKGGPARVTPLCPHVDRCGGCDWMHLSLDAQTEAHAALVRNALPPTWREHPILTHRADQAFGYRRRARLHIRASGGRAIVGMHGAGTRDPVEVETCRVLDPTVENARQALPALFEGAHGRGEAQIALGRMDEGVARAVLDIRWSGELPGACFGRLERDVAAGRLAGARVFCGEVSRPATVGDPTPWMLGADKLPFRLAPGGFAQASLGMNTVLAQRVATFVEGVAAARGALRIVELYAGAGNLSVLIAGARGPSSTLTTVDASQEACEAARANLSARGPRASVVHADADAYVIPSSTDLVLLDPPRTGARAVTARIVESRPKHVVYVSCDPPTLGRDLKVLERTYEPVAIETFEMFPQTSHVETLIGMRRQEHPR